LSSPSQSIQGIPPSQPDYTQTLRTEAETAWDNRPHDAEDHMFYEYQNNLSPDDQELIEAMELVSLTYSQ
jgi:hypothetical protein